MGEAIRMARVLRQQSNGNRNTTAHPLAYYPLTHCPLSMAPAKAPNSQLRICATVHEHPYPSGSFKRCFRFEFKSQTTVNCYEAPRRTF
ncbi:hypothetical protein Q31a_18290 [Aureliella helgolandensis]|uniref:Uncharacterized protein n=1 Tax=Aureliella helgolandensis TaxID=2527968 RepID=A0A518G4K9_9BACT|nr:hypothetical protein Q31a_18290 [Aureliella helgolandensis]